MADKPRLLLVDDDTVALQVLSKSLTPFARMRFARSGAEALKAVETELPDLLLLDVNMPGLNGLQVLGRLRSQAATADLPVILLTGDRDESLEASALELGAQDFIRKPFQPELLLNRIRALLRLAALRGPRPRPELQLAQDGARILLVDDDPCAIAAMRASLEPIGATLVTADDGEQALRQMQTEVPDLVLLDAEMPRLDGYAVCQAMQLDPVLAQVPVAFVSIHAEASFEARSFAVGAADFLAKPFKPEVLLARVRKLLQLRHERDDSLAALAAQWQELGDRRVAELVAVASDAIVSIDAKGSVRLMNKAASVLFNVAVERALGQPAEAVLPGWMALDFAVETMGLANERRRQGRPGRAFRLFRGDGAARTVEPIVFQQGSDAHCITTVLLRDATDRIAAEQRREAHRDAVVASATQLALLSALATDPPHAGDLVALAQGRTAIPPYAPQLKEFDLAQALTELTQWVQAHRPQLCIKCVTPNRILGALGERTHFVAGFQTLLTALAGTAPQQLVIEIACKVDELLVLELQLPRAADSAALRAAPDWRYALTQLCAGGAVESMRADAQPVPATLVFKLLRPNPVIDVLG